MSDEVAIAVDNPQLILISGQSTAGKSASLRNIPNQERWLLGNCEAGKRLPFKNKFREGRITNPYQVLEMFDYALANPDAVDGVILDTLTFWMDMFESMYVVPSTNTMQAWGQYAQIFKTLMQQKIAAFGKPVIILAHARSELNEKEMRYEVSVPVKGSLKNQGIEAYFSTVVMAKRMELKALEPYQNERLVITPDDELVGYKHVFQTRQTKETVGERIRSPMGMFDVNETFIDNCAYSLLKHMNSYYND